MKANQEQFSRGLLAKTVASSNGHKIKAAQNASVSFGHESDAEEPFEKDGFSGTKSTLSMTSSEVRLILQSSKQDVSQNLNSINTFVSKNHGLHLFSESDAQKSSSHDVIHHPIVENTITKFHNIYQKRNQNPSKVTPNRQRKFSVDANSSSEIRTDLENVNMEKIPSFQHLQERRRVSLPDPKLLPQVTSVDANLVIEPCLLQLERFQNAQNKRVHGPLHVLANRIRKFSISSGSSNCLSGNASDVADDFIPRMKSHQNYKERRRVSLPDTAQHLRSHSSSDNNMFAPLSSTWGRCRKTFFAPSSKHAGFHPSENNHWKNRSASQLQNISPLVYDDLTSKRPPFQKGNSCVNAPPQPNVTILENEKFIIFKNRLNDSTCANKFQWERIREESFRNPNTVFITFLNRATCYDLVPMSSKIVVLDVLLNVKKAFSALIYNGVRAAPLWDSEKQCFIGMLTVADFITILCKNYPSSQLSINEIETYSIKSWRQIFGSCTSPDLICIGPDTTLYDALDKLLSANVHRLPIIDSITGNIIHLVTPKRIIKFLSFFLDSLTLPEWFKWSLKRLNIGTYANVLVVEENTPLIKVLSHFVEHRISALPVINSENKLKNIYSKFDAINLAAKQSYNNLDITVREALMYREDRFEGVATCTCEDSLEDVFHRIVQAEIHRFVVVDVEQHVIGIVSLSDLLKFLMQPPNLITNELEVELTESIF